MKTNRQIRAENMKIKMSRNEMKQIHGGILPGVGCFCARTDKEATFSFTCWWPFDYQICAVVAGCNRGFSCESVIA